MIGQMIQFYSRLMIQTYFINTEDYLLDMLNGIVLTNSPCQRIQSYWLLVLNAIAESIADST